MNSELQSVGGVGNMDFVAVVGTEAAAVDEVVGDAVVVAGGD